ncbi:palmitoyltransferase ZDHHC4 isoform X1 [Pongo abelii]|uniref:Palmitoyltransferase n=2 Tax=Pongo abelii TaxID=9601 RepID=A0A2J8R542_PONAB|nr:palmitoyltransferase ZDHHC4 isoform X1 [Pongo abelii]XP_002817734.2 palmitoyltransferase ZDHHC4 isoform X1 [Pongo abelii]XP_002817736.2 palmitoyltransferase ZDHHC4 isoform X1 [Pongo abelii]XP_009240810.2 palmitoyltransferase ZDHHC4 isoform X1 [Pongo abelii]XP_009240811.2 palmitoyltransferase ZDHHC4 isoform X1 [Pongo abelii]XP_024105801.1 palmitoyltransferase ZDHHC4 isoform X1 [Pongo abelii]XP_024105802.1 palmitoyltransferase ZDHHC4 isoform X1 [Pongo abelii]PNJ03626.1 ZDHHC4 isoform 1 [Pon
MDFLVLFLFYLASVLMGLVLICVCLKTHSLKGLARGGAQIFSCIIPERLQRAVHGLLHYLFHTRNHTFIVLHLVLQGMVYTEYTWEVFGYCQELDFSLYYLLLPYLLLVVNLFSFTLTCVTNPGVITKANELLFLHVYEFDELMFPKNVRCSTCDLRKPARSKHCSVCNWCVHRFDHHCVWVNNCIGAWNIRYFLIYLLTLTASAATVAIVSTTFLVHLVVMSDLYQETYTDDLGHLHVMDTVFLIQYLFLTFPRIVFMLGFVMVLSFLLGGYLCFALYLAATNQTTNEWYRGDWAWCQHCPLVARPPSAEPQVHRNIHSHGLRSNLQEIFLPAFPCHERKKQE